MNITEQTRTKKKKLYVKRNQDKSHHTHIWLNQKAVDNLEVANTFYARVLSGEVSNSIIVRRALEFLGGRIIDLINAKDTKDIYQEGIKLISHVK